MMTVRDDREIYSGGNDNHGYDKDDYDNSSPGRHEQEIVNKHVSPQCVDVLFIPFQICVPALRLVGSAPF